MVVIEYENTSSTLLSPQVFRRYCLPYLNEYADILKAAGKIFMVHMCGKLQAFADDLAAAHFDGIADISPQPTGNFTLDEAAACLGGKIVVGGIDATTFIEPDLRQVESKVAQLIRRLKPYQGVLLGSADTAPRGTSLETFRLVNHLASTAGSYLAGSEAAYQPGQFVASLATSIKPAPVTPASSPALDAPGNLDIGAILQELARRLDGRRPEVSGVIKFNVTGDCVYRLYIDQGKCRLEISDGPADASMTANPANLLALFTGKLTPMSAFMARKIKFDGNLKLLGVLTAAQE